MSARKTTEEFVAQANTVHGTGKYNYDKVVYFTAHTKVIITCERHGDFEQAPHNHLKGYGCLKCGGSEQSTTEEFISKSNVIHGGKYNYDKVVYLKNKSRVVITCMQHGDFEQTPNSHLYGQGCPKCAGNKKTTQEEFLAKSEAIHGNEYRYDKVEYVNTDTKVFITCLKHGDFTQSPYRHLQGAGCPKCGGTEKLTTEEFIVKSNAIHGGKYNYDKAVYLNSKTKVMITCKNHGDFMQAPVSHMSGKGCLKCSGKEKSTTEEFISKSNAIHGGKYNYDKVEYFSNKAKVVIACLEHGDFEQTPNAHLNGVGCPKCGGTSKSTTEEFITKSNAVHGGKYNYDNVVYFNCNTNVVITCKKHGDFEQRPEIHLRGNGCSKCSGTAKSTTEEFITKSKSIHGNQYNYDKVVYFSGKSKVVIACNNHGDFKQRPTDHIRGQGCPKCACRAPITTEEFIFRSESIHGSKYNYDKVVYLVATEKVVITCKKHGDFEQLPHKHLKGYGCAKCQSSKGETAIRIWLEKRNCKFKEQAKFQSCKNVNPLPFDFEVSTPERTLIEFHGQQHYEPMSFSNSRKDTQEQMEANLARVQHNDAIKAKWCEDNNVPLLVIPYWDKHRIPELLEEFLGSASLVVAT